MRLKPGRDPSLSRVDQPGVPVVQDLVQPRALGRPAGGRADALARSGGRRDVLDTG